MTRRSVFELEQDADSPKQNFSIKCDRHTLPGNPSGIANTNGCKGSDFPPDGKRHRPYIYQIETTLITSILLPLLYATHLLVAYELILTTPPGSLPYSWLPVNLLAVIGWLSESYCNPNSLLFKAIERRAASMSTPGNHPFAIITAMFGSRHASPRHQPSESSVQQVPHDATQLKGSLTSSLNSGSGGGDRDPQQQAHTLGLNCYVYPCHGICQFRISFDIREPAEWLPNFEESSTGLTEKSGQSPCSHLADGYCLDCRVHFDPTNPTCSQQLSSSGTLNNLSAIQVQCTSGQLFQAHDINDHPANSCNYRESMVARATCSIDPTGPVNDDVSKPVNGINHFQRALSGHKHNHRSKRRTCDVTVVGEDGQQQPCGKVCKRAQGLPEHKCKYHDGPKTCNVTVVGQNGQLQSCGRTCKNSSALSTHRSRFHSGQRTCDAPAVRVDGQLKPCGKVFKNAQSMYSHKKSHHSGPKTCDFSIVRGDVQQRPCGRVFQSAQALATHKNRAHSGEQTCKVMVVTEDGRLQPCGKICKNTLNLSSHKGRVHGVIRTCDATLIGEDGQQRPCGTVCRNTKVLSNHKRSFHSGQQVCDVIVIGEDGQPQPCGKVCKNAPALSLHTRRNHGELKVCEAIVLGENGQQRPCWKICKSALALSDHKRIHRKRKPVDVKQNDKFSP
ncbi:hypothetical protein [Endozoicomonas sp. 8E]|uniref:hypothetical protein n=1 Tax=Endozoicomonas sp. 8E TaxID=3035692 RepID=UPI002938D4A9|nr:hypothetical protein [Endozoicomonas sp. 8E]WOG27102.1 hypothetical protein P6910_21505 [Endozoicomonas sp. 8E]